MPRRTTRAVDVGVLPRPSSGPDVAPPAHAARRHAIATVVVVVPARDEAATIGACLRSVAASLRHLPDGCVGRVVVVDDGSRDGTADVARDALRGTQACVVTTTTRGVGPARRLGVAVGTRDVGDPARCWVLSTDADCVVGPGWASSHLDHARRGALAVAGTVRLVEDDDGRRAAAVWAAEYLTTLAADGTHPHVHGANLGVRLDAYLAAGGFPDAPRGEDHALWRGLRAGGVVPVADGALSVLTSARRVGRAPDGFADAVAALVAAGAASGAAASGGAA